MVAALQSLFTNGQMSRADLARSLGLNRSSSGQIVTQLTESGLVCEVHDSTSRRGEEVKAGRPGIMLALVPDAAFFIGIEIGVEHITTVRINLCGEVEDYQATVFDAVSATVGDAVKLAVSLATGGLEAHRMSKCKGIGLSVPAHITADGTVKLAPLMRWRNVDIAGLVRRELSIDVPIIVENDANAFAIGDGYKNGRSGVTLFLCMETGVGGGILIDGKLFRGGHGLAGEIGHIRAAENGSAEIEQLIGRDSLLRNYRKASAKPGCDFATFLSDVEDRVPVAVTIAEEWSRNLAFALVHACRLIDPHRIVLGGSVASLYPMVAARVAAYMAEGETIDFPKPDIVVDKAPEHGSAFGAACLLHQRFMSLANADFFSDDRTDDHE